ncbi:MAG: hypothetical protein QF570_09975 [Myxococcota bacterium]|jgi:hypothetical protein|nr:hypothetical protein [Myxococcota bacterium]
MKIPSPENRDEHIAQLRDGLTQLLEQPTAAQVRPCAGCSVRCACPAASIECCCGCTTTCRDAGAQLSSEADRYPIEHRVLPLVYGLATMRVVMPCWSCQGHPATRDGGCVKAPQIWFYSLSLVHVHLIGQFVADAHAGRELRHEWHVRTNPYSERNVPIFILEPRMSAEEITQRDCLNDIQHDLHHLGKDFEQRIRAFAARELTKLESETRRECA